MLTKKTLWIALVALVVIVGAFFGGRAWFLKQRAETQAAALAEGIQKIEQEFGVHINFIGVTADGGLIDFRYTVIDPGKAFDLYEPEYLPKLIAEDSGIELTLRQPDHEHELEAGRAYYLIFRNMNNALRSGSLVTIVVGDLVLEHFVAQ